MAYSILSLKVQRGALGGTVLVGGPRLSDVVKGDSDDPERLARRVVRTKWGPMTSVLDGFFAALFEKLAATDGTLADAPADVAKAARAVDLELPDNEVRELCHDGFSLLVKFGPPVTTKPSTPSSRGVDPLGRPRTPPRHRPERIPSIDHDME